MLEIQIRKVQQFLILFLLLGVSRAEACVGCLPLEYFLYTALPLHCLFCYCYPLYLLHRLISWFSKDAKTCLESKEWGNRTLNCLLLGYADFAAIVFVQRVFPSRLRFFKLLSPLFFNPLVLAAIAYYALSKCEWADHLFKQARWVIIWPFFVVAATGFQGHLYAWWDYERTMGLFVFLTPFVLAYFSIPENIRPWWPAKQKKPPVTSVHGSICKLCGKNILDKDYVQCSDCSTIMHRECWEWNGRSCVVYRCQSRQVKRNRKGIKALGLRRVSSLAVAGN